MHIKAYGVYIFVGTQSKLEEVSIIAIVTQIASGIGLILATKIFTDFIMMTFFREKNHYRNMKYIRTENI